MLLVMADLSTQDRDVAAQRRLPLVVFPAAQALSSLGDSALWLAAGLWVRQATGSNSAAALTFMLYLMSSLCSPWLGALVDRYDRRSLIIYGNMCGAAAVLPCLLLPNTWSGVFIVYIVVFVNGLAANCLNPAYAAFAADTISPRHLPGVNSAIRIAQTVFRVFAPLLGAWLYHHVGIVGVALADAATFVAAAALISLVRARRARELIPTPVSYGAAIRSALEVRSLRSLIAPTILFTVSLGLLEATMWAVVTNGLGRPARYISILQAATAIGAVLGGIVASRLVRKHGQRVSFVASLFVVACGIAPQVFPVDVIVVAGSVVAGFGTSILVIAAMTAIQTDSPPQRMGRVFAGYELISTVPQMLAVGAASLGLLYFDYRILIAVSFVACLLGGSLASRSNRRIRGN